MLLIDRSTAARRPQWSCSCPGNHAKSLAHHFRGCCRGPRLTRGRFGHARLPASSLRVRRLHVDWAPDAPGFARKPFPAHGCSGMCGTSSRPCSIPRVQVCVPFSKSDADHAEFLSASRSQASGELGLPAQLVARAGRPRYVQQICFHFCVAHLRALTERTFRGKIEIYESGFPSGRSGRQWRDAPPTRHRHRV